MFIEGHKIYYVDTFDGTIHEGRFIENAEDGMWIRLKGLTFNTFAYSDYLGKKVFPDQSSAQAGLETIRSKIKSGLLKDNYFIKDILERLGKSEGKLYLGIIGEILNESTRSR